MTDAAWARAQAAIRLRSKGICERCPTPVPEGDSHHIHGRGAGKRDDHPDALLNLCRTCHDAAKIERKEAAWTKETHALYDRPERGIDTEISGAGRSDVSAMCVTIGKATVPARNVDRELVLPPPRRLFLP